MRSEQATCGHTVGRRPLERQAFQGLRVSLSVAAAIAALATPVRAWRTQVETIDTVALRSRLQARLDSVHAAGRFPGATFAVALPNGGSLALSVGLADTVLRTPMRPDSRMLAGSVGKTFFAALALQLVDEGRLDLDAPISNWLGDEPWFARLPNGSDITVRQLMTHTSGLVRYEFDGAVTDKLTAEPDHVWTPEERVSYILDTEPPFAAGAGWEYSDTNYIVLGMILERITGEALYPQIARRVIDPLGLPNTVPSDRRQIAGLVQGYAGPNNPFGGRDAMLEDGAMIVNPQMEWAGGGYASTSHDLARWAKALYEARVFSAATLTIATQGTPARGLGRGASYGLGVIISATPLGTSWGHSGFFPGWLTEMRYYPDHDFAVAIQFNTSVSRAIGRSPGAILQELADIVAESLTG